jgi:hypothetical protein
VNSYKLGFWAAATVVVIGLIYIVVLIIGFYQVGFDKPIADPILAVMEVLTVFSALAILIAIASVYHYALPERKIFGLIALIFAAIFTGITSTVHLLELTASRQLGVAEIAWPSSSYAAELIAWDWFLGLALILSALVFPSRGTDKIIHRTLLISGVLTFVGIVGPITGEMQLQRIGIFGYAIVLPIAFFFLSRMFRCQILKFKTSVVNQKSFDKNT